MRILITGASGFIGRHLADALLAEGHHVIAAVRRPDVFPALERCRAVAMDFSRDTTPECWLPRLRDIDAVVNCVGIIGEDRHNRFDDLHRRGPIALFQACEQAGIRRVVQVSALGAESGAFSRYHLSKKAADDFLASTELDWVVLQPSMVYGPGGASLALFSALAALPRTPLLGNGRQWLQPVHIDDLVAAVKRVLAPAAPSRQRMPLVGPRPIAMNDFLALLRRWLGYRPAPAVSAPWALVLPMADLIGRWVATPFNGEALRMLRVGNTGDPSELTKLLGHAPIAPESVFKPGGAQQADRWHAGLYLLMPALRMALALLWIWSGLTSAFLFPKVESYGLLAAVGVTGVAAPIALHGLSLVDATLGVALLLRYRVRMTALFQIGLMTTYTLAIALILPQFLFHPYAPLVKNLPLIVATLILLVTEES
jgi:uncharacterized protein YbjT (DUF2867 family)